MAQDFSLEKEKHIRFARQMAKQYNLPEDLFLGQLDQESNWNPKAVSRTGAKGIGQFQAKWHPLGSWKFKKKEDYFDPQKSIESAAMYMSSLKKQYSGNYMAALAHYNGGTRQGQLVASGKDPEASETANYLPYIQEKAQKYAKEPGFIGNTVNAIGDNVNQTVQSVQESMTPPQPSQNPNMLSDQKQETIKNLTNMFTNASQAQPMPQGPRPGVQQTPYRQDPETQRRIAELEQMLSQRKLQDQETQMGALQHQQMLNQQQQEKARRSSIANITNSLSSFPSPYQSPQVPNIGYEPSQNPVPQAQVSYNNPWQGMQRRLGQ